MLSAGRPLLPGAVLARARKPKSTARDAQAPDRRRSSRRSRAAAGSPSGSGSTDSFSSTSDSEDDAASVAAALLQSGVGSDLRQLDPEVLASLPQSMQLDILDKIRDAQQSGVYMLSGWVRGEAWLIVGHL
jgi:hypothetical protein